MNIQVSIGSCFFFVSAKIFQDSICTTNYVFNEVAHFPLDEERCNIIVINANASSSKRREIRSIFQISLIYNTMQELICVLFSFLYYRIYLYCYKKTMFLCINFITKTLSIITVYYYYTNTKFHPRTAKSIKKCLTNEYKVWSFGRLNLKKKSICSIFLLLFNKTFGIYNIMMNVYHYTVCNSNISLNTFIIKNYPVNLCVNMCSYFQTKNIIYFVLIYFGLEYCKTYLIL